MFLRVPVSLILVGALFLQLSACDAEQSGKNGDAPAAGNTLLRRGNGGDPQTLDPARADDSHAFNVLIDLYEGLVSIDADANIIPGVAKSWNVSNDGLTYTFHLRADARWSNGEPVNAAHFLDGFRRTLTPETNSAYSFLLSPIKNAKAVMEGDMLKTELGVSAPDDRTLVIHLESPTPQLLSVLAQPIAFPIWHEGDVDLDQFSDPEKFIGNGPFTLLDWQLESIIRLQKNPNYWAQSDVHLDKVEFYALAEPVSELNRYRAGEIDITATVPGPHVPALRESHPTELRIAPSLGVYYIAFDLSEAPLDSRELRQALSMAIDREALVKVIGRGEQPAYGFIPGGVRAYSSSRFSWAELSESERVQRALELYRQAGYSESNPLKFTLMYDTGDIHETVALAVSSMWREVLGAVVELDKREWKYFLATRENRDDWQAMRFAWTGDYNHPATFSDILQSGSPQNLPGYVSTRYDELLSAARMATDIDEQMRLLADAEGQMLSDNPIAPLYFYVSKHMVSTSIIGFNDNALDQHPSRFIRFRQE